ncbi:hypothetical protein [Candidatus Nitrosocosmicus sp. T]
MSNHSKNHNKLYLVISFFIASALIFTSLIASNGALAQPSNSNKLSKVEKCASGDLPPSACKKASDRSQTNSGGIDPGQAGNGSARTNMDGNGGRASTDSSPGGLNTANSTINQNQQSTQLCATGNIKALPHSTIICNNNADLDQANNGDISTDQTADGRLTKP